MKLIPLGMGNWDVQPNLHPPAFLLETNHGWALFDAGYGTIHQLAVLKFGVQKLRAICITHFHGDHWADLAHLLHHWTLKTSASDATRSILHVTGPTGICERITYAYQDNLSADLLDGRILVTRNFPYHIHPMNELAYSGTYSFSVNHIPSVECFGYVYAHAGKKFVYTGDIGPEQSPTFFKVIRDADLLLIEAGSKDNSSTAHLTPEKACQWAVESGAKRTVLFHVGHDQRERVHEYIRQFPNIILPNELETIQF